MKYFLATLLKQGKRSTQTIESTSLKEAKAYVKQKRLGTIVTITEVNPPISKQLHDLKNKLLVKKVKTTVLIGAMRQLAVMSEAGIPLLDALQEISESTEDPHLSAILENIASEINMGSTLTQTFKHYERELGKLSVTLVALGEQTGNLASAFTTLSNMLEEMNENMIKFKKAIAYPRNVMLAMMVAFVVMISYVVPKFKSIFDRLGADLPLPTQILLSLEHGLNNYGLYLLAGIIFFIFIFLWQMNSNYKFKYTVHALLLKTYLIKDIILFSSLHRFSLVFAELIHAGIPIIDALQSATELIENEVLKTKLTSIAKNVEQGSALHTSLKETGLFENMLIQMINAGEQSGQLDTMMKKVEHYLKMRFDAIISNLSQSIEPILLFFIAGMVILLALGIFLPMWDMGNAVKH